MKATEIFSYVGPVQNTSYKTAEVQRCILCSTAKDRYETAARSY